MQCHTKHNAQIYWSIFSFSTALWDKNPHWCRMRSRAFMFYCLCKFPLSENIVHNQTALYCNLPLCPPPAQAGARLDWSRHPLGGQSTSGGCFGSHTWWEESSLLLKLHAGQGLLVLEHAGVKHGRGPVGLLQGCPLGQGSHDIRGDALPSQTEGGQWERKKKKKKKVER